MATPITEDELEFYRRRPLRVYNGARVGEWLIIPEDMHAVRLLTPGTGWEHIYDVMLYAHEPYAADEPWIGPIHGPTIYEFVLRTIGPGRDRRLSSGIW